jgi:hypothetical protein
MTYSYRQIQPRLLLGDFETSLNGDLLSELKVTHIFRIMNFTDKELDQYKKQHIKGIQYYYCDIVDMPRDAKKLYGIYIFRMLI